MLNACASLQALTEGRHAHEKVIQIGCETDLFVGSSLINVYAKCGSMEDAQIAFDKIPSHNVVCWTIGLL